MKPAAIQILVVAAGFVVLLAGYLAAVHLAVQIPAANGKIDANQGDLIYFLIHSSSLAFALVLGFALGKWLSGLGIAFALLLAIAMSVSMVSIQVGSFQLACDGHNDLVRHWTC